LSQTSFRRFEFPEFSQYSIEKIVPALAGWDKALLMIQFFLNHPAGGRAPNGFMDAGVDSPAEGKLFAEMNPESE